MKPRRGPKWLHSAGKSSCLTLGFGDIAFREKDVVMMRKVTETITVEEDGELLFFCLPTMVLKSKKVQQRS